MRPLLLLLVALLIPAASAQVGIGGQLGSPTGLSIRAGQGRGAVLLAVGWGGDDRVEAEGHYLLRERRLQGSDLRVYLGPGVFVRTGEDRDPDLGLSLALGLTLRLAPEIEVYGHLSPRLQLVRETDTDLGAALGLRVFL